MFSEQLGFDEEQQGVGAVHGQAPANGGAAAVVGSDGQWLHAASGLWLPRGSVVTRELTDDERVDLDARSAARGVRQGERDRRKVKRSAADEAQLQAFCEWLSSEGLDIFGMVSFTDEYAARYCIYSFRRALDDVWRGLADCPMNRSRRIGFPGKFVLSSEWHPSGRLVPHVHLALESAGAPMERVCKELWQHFFHSRGRCRFEPMRDQNIATLYALKDTVKASARDADCVRFRMWNPKRRRSA